MFYKQIRFSSFFAVAFFAASLCCGTAKADTFGSGANTFDIEFVTIDNPGNLDDTDDGDQDQDGQQFFGGVRYTYRIAKYEISQGMVDMAIAHSIADGDPLGITLADLGSNKPAVVMSWADCAMFVNWLNTNTGNTPAYKFDESDNFQLWQPGDAGYDPGNRFRNKQAKYVLPNDDEWYKAAYYDPNTELYYNYPTGIDNTPDGIDFAGDTIFDAVFYQGGVTDQPHDVTNVGLLSPYGTAGQGGTLSRD